MKTCIDFQHDTETLTMFKLNDCAAHLKVPKLFGGQKGSFENGVQPVLVMQDFSETTAMQNFLQGANMEQVRTQQVLQRVT